MPSRTVKENQANFVFHVKIGEYEVKIDGNREEVLKTIKELPDLMADVYKAMRGPKPETTRKLTIKATAAKKEASIQEYPKIPHPQNCSEAILNILATEWGKWRPRTVSELKKALKTNKLHYPGRTLAGVLSGLVKKGKVRRWETDAGYVYILAEKEVLN